MKLSVMQPYLFPYIGYFHLISASDKFVCYNDVHFIKQGWINRNRILLNGEAHTFSVPVKNISSHTLIRETEIDYHLDWRKKLLKTIQSAYSKAPNFEIVFPLISKLFESKPRYISELAIESIKLVLNYADFKVDLIEDASRYENSALKGENRVIDICKKEKASEYFNLPGGKELYNYTTFEKNNIQLRFIQPDFIEYSQQIKDFIPGLSAIDVMMFNSGEGTKEIMNAYRIENKSI